MTRRTATFLKKALAIGAPTARVAVVAAKGSTPREVGAFMFVSATQCEGTIGGGRLEFEAIAAARALLADGRSAMRMALPLGPNLGQCCGGHVTLEIVRADAAMLAQETAEAEAADRHQPEIDVFGAGHVGRALVAALALLPFRTRWIDERTTEIHHAAPTDNVEIVVTSRYLEEVARAPAHTAFVILTHSHGLDALIAAAVLERGDFSYCGIIGSKTKRRRFEQSFRAAGIAADRIARITCPIGDTTIRDKRPEIIAALVAAELIGVFAGAIRYNHARRGKAA
jgi:xanthine dehydrogenase accessory protein XdhC